MRSGHENAVIRKASSKKTAFRTALTAVALVTIVVGGGTGAVAAEQAVPVERGDDEKAPRKLTAEQMAGAPGASWYAMNANGEILSSEDNIIDLAPPEPALEGEVSPYLIDDPFAWAACFLNYDETYPLASYTWWYTSQATMTIELQCGYHNSATGAGHGWHHIAAGHEQQWRNRIIQTGESSDGAGWDDLMSWVNLETISWPYYNERQSNYKVCVSSATLMYDGDGDYVYTFWPSVIFTEDTKRIITSIPSSYSVC